MNKFLDILAMIFIGAFCVFFMVCACFAVWFILMSGDTFLQAWIFGCFVLVVALSWASVRLDGMK